MAWRTPEDSWTHWMAQSTSGSQAETREWTDSATCVWPVYLCSDSVHLYTHMCPEENYVMKYGALREMLCCMALKQDWLPIPKAVWY